MNVSHIWYRLPVLSALLSCSVALAGNWPQWRGPHGTGVCDEPDLPLHWNADQGVRWHVPLPDRGNSTPVIWGDRVFITQAIEKDHRRTVMCFSRDDGKLLWQSGVTYADPEPTNGQNPYCSSSPATDGQRVVAYFGSAGLYCYTCNTGELIWHLDTGKVDSWQGSGSSPILFDGLCFLNAGPGTHAALIACDSATGQEVWRAIPPKAGAGFTAKPGAPPGGGFDNAIMQAAPTGAGGFLGSWATPVIVHQDDHDELIVVHAERVTSYEPRTGRVIWTCAGLPDQAFASPAIGEGILVATGHRVSGGGTRVTAVRLGGTGDVTASRRLWQIDLPKECVGSGVIHAGHVYLVTQFGSIVCLDLSTGQKVREKRLSGQGELGGSWSTILLCGQKMFVPNHSGEVFIIAALPGMDVLGINWGGQETTCASLAACDKELFLRTYKTLWCLGPAR